VGLLAGLESLRSSTQVNNSFFFLLPMLSKIILFLIMGFYVLVFWPHSVFGQNHLYVRMLQTGIPLFRVTSEEFQSSLSAERTMCHPVRTPICLLFHPSGRRVFPSGRQTDKHHLFGRRVSSVRTPASYREASVPACSIWTFQQHVRTPIRSRTVH
jgi:hypothetical protein